MDQVVSNSQYRAAAFAYDNAYPYDDAAEARAERMDQMVLDYMADTDKVAEADDWIDGTQSGEHYSELERAMADLHTVHPSDLLGSDVLARLYRLAKVHGDARLAQLREMVQRECEA